MNLLIELLVKEKMMVKRKQSKELKVNTVFTPVQDWDARLKRVLEMLIKRSYDKDIDNKEGGSENA